MVSSTLRAQRIQERAERAVAYWIDRLADNDLPFLGSEDEERFLPLSALLAELLQRGAAGAEDSAALDKADAVADQIEAYGMGTEGMRIRARGAHEDMMARRDEPDAPLERFRDTFEQLMSQLHAIDSGRVTDLGASLLEARELLLQAENLAQGG